MSRAFMRSVALLIVLLSGFAHADDWSIDIAPTLSISRGTFLDANEVFYVVFTNLTNHDLALTVDALYGGETDLSFLCTLPDGKQVILRPTKPLFISSSPVITTVHASGHYVFPIQLIRPKEGPGYTWTSDPDRKTLDLSSLLNKRDVSVVIAFSHHVADVGPEHITAWTGEVKSKPFKIMFLP
jgi:hypothetical protein